MKKIIWQSLFIACLAVAAWPRDPGRLPLRQIDRPLILPKGMWQERLTWTQVLPFEENYKNQGTEDIRGFLPGLPSWSITDNLSWSAVPAPLFQYLLTRNNIQVGTRPVVEDFSLALHGGLASISYSKAAHQPARFSYSPLLGLSFKKPWSGRLWNEGVMQTFFTKSDPYSVMASLGLGVQISNRIHAITSYSATQVIPDGYHLYHAVTQRCGVNFNTGLSLDGGLEFLAGDGKNWMSPSAVLSFQW